jgi:DNA polymerase-3 subunit epsilon
VSFRSFLPLEWRRRGRARSAPEGPLRDFYRRRFPSASADWRSVGFLALDLETTGFDPATEEIVSAGWVQVTDGQIELGTARRRIVRPSKDMPETSAVIHAITDDEAAAGEPLCGVIEEVLVALGGRVLIAHYAATELRFLDAACLRCLRGGLLVPVVDTLQLARRRCAREGRDPERGELRLDALRRHHNLPRHDMHDALGDAIAAAELFLAQVETVSEGGPWPLGRLLTRW